MHRKDLITQSLLALLSTAALLAACFAAYLAPLAPHGEVDLVTPAVVMLCATCCVGALVKSKRPLVAGIAIAMLIVILMLWTMAVGSFLAQLKR